MHQKAENEARFLTETDAAASAAALTGRQKAVLVLFILAFAVMIYGVIPWEDLGIGLPTLWWWFPEMTASFLFFAILIAVVGPDVARPASRQRSWTAPATCSASRSSSGSPAGSRSS